MNEDENLTRQAKDGVEVISAVIKAAGNNPNVKEAANELGKTALTVTQTLNNVLLPLAAVNFAFDKAKLYFSDTFPKELSNKTKEIPAEHLVEPKASIAGPALQALAFAHEEESLKELFLNLLKTSMDSQTAQNAHPAFVELIKQMNSEEADLLTKIIFREASPIVQYAYSANNFREYEILQSHIIPTYDSEAQSKQEHERIGAYIDNWNRMGLIEVTYIERLHNDNEYEWIDKHPSIIYQRQKLQKDNNKHENIKRGIITRTYFGEMFANAAGIKIE